MLTDFHPKKIYIATGYTDLRFGLDGLAGIVQGEFHLNAFEDALFLFCGKRNDRIKGLYWDSNGFVLLYKRLENGRFKWPRNEREAKLLTPKQYEWLCAGFEIEPKNKPVKTDGLRYV